MTVAQPAGAVLYVGLKMKDGVAEAVMPASRYLAELLQQPVGFAGDQLRQSLAVQALEQDLITGKEAAIEKRKRELQIVLVEAAAVGESSGSRADAQAAVPQCLT